MKATKSNIVYVVDESGDWEGVYVDGVLRCEDHQIPARYLLKAMGIKFREVEASVEDRLPKYLEDL